MDPSPYIPVYAVGAAAAAAAACAGAWLAPRAGALPADPRRLDRAFWGVWLAVAAVFVGLSVRSLSSYRKFFDTAVETQVIRNIAAGKGPVSSINASGMRDADPEASYLAYHASLAYYAVALLWRLWPDPAMVVGLGALCVALGAVPVWRISRARLGATGWALAPPLAYLLMPTVHYAALWELHATSLAVPLLGFAVLAADRERPGRLWAWGLAALTVREDVALMGICLGIFAAARSRRLRVHGLLFAAAALAHFLLATRVWMPAVSTREGWYQMHLYSHLGGSVPEILRTLLAEPLKVLGMLAETTRWGSAVLFALPFAFLPLASGRWTLLFLPYFALLFLGRDPAFYSVFLYYAVPLLPAAAAAASVAVSRWDAIPRLRAMGALAGASLAASVAFGAAPWSTQFWSREWRLAPFREPYFHRSAYAVGAHEAAAERLLASIPPDASVVAAHYFLPQLIDRRAAYLLVEADRIPERADWAILDRTRENRYLVPSYAAIEQALASRGFEVVGEEDGVVVLKKGGPAGAGSKEPRR